MREEDKALSPEQHCYEDGDRHSRIQPDGTFAGLAPAAGVGRERFKMLQSLSWIALHRASIHEGYPRRG